MLCPGLYLQRVGRFGAVFFDDKFDSYYPTIS
ncbi:hypothetical protein CLV93_10133 [Prolixibacter denitrificans]|uniref:Uncharacterized protein n=1 Tax=Prolixibacter denitrificans TaxID=1541063 RepID=A0A2P8CJF0_9BACT|nr:hypothetical protein CLV93_10133 [Prolixibacter denitrificans]